MRRDDRLRPFACAQIDSQCHRLRRLAVLRDQQAQRAAGVIVPDFGGVDPVPMRALTARQQEIDRGRCSAAAGVSPAVAKRFAIVSALRMRLQVEARDDLGGGEPVHRCRPVL